MQLIKIDKLEDYFDIDSLAIFLHLTPEQVRKMADRNQLPGQRVGGQWRFPRREVYHWFEERIGLSDDIQLQHFEKLLSMQESPSIERAVTIAELLPSELIWLNCNSRSKNSLIRDVCQFAATKGFLWDAQKMATAIQNREQLNSTAMENGVAFLHPRRPQTDNFAEPFLALAITPSGIPFGDPRGGLTDIFFMIASNSDALHLKLLARLSRTISLPWVANELRTATDVNQIKSILIKAESSLA